MLNPGSDAVRLRIEEWLENLANPEIGASVSLSAVASMMAQEIILMVNESMAEEEVECEGEHLRFDGSPVFMPDGDLLTGVIQITHYTDLEGEDSFGMKVLGELNKSAVVGLLELAKHRLLIETD